MLSALLNWLSPARRRFMRECGRPGLNVLRQRLSTIGSPRAVAFMSTLLDANLEFLAFALSADGPLAPFAQRANPQTVEACLRATLIFSVNLFARDEFAQNESELIPLLAAVTENTPIQIMLRRDNLRKAPRSEEWMLYTWMVAALAEEKPAHDRELERRFSYNYLAYIEQYRPLIEREATRPES